MLPIAGQAQSVTNVMGHYNSDSIADEGYALPNSGSKTVAIMLEPEELDIFLGGKVVAVRVGLVQPAAITKVFFIPVLGAAKYGTRVNYSCEMGDAGWITLQLPTPYELNLEEGQKLLVGFTYQQTLNETPLSFVKQGLPYDIYMPKVVGKNTKWEAVGLADQGNLSIQCIVEKDSYPDYRLNVYDLHSDYYVKRGDPVNFALTIHNRGIKQINLQELAVNVLIDGKFAATLTNETPFVDGFCSFAGQVAITGLQSGSHVLTVQPVSVAGEPVEDVEPLECEFVTYKQAFERQKHLVEQLTSTYCMWCPLGSSMLSKLTQERDDAIWVGLHGNLGGGVDPFRSSQCDSLLVYLTGGSISYPSAAFDRSVGWADDVNVVSGIGFYEEYHQEIVEYFDYFFDYITGLTPTFAEIKGDCTFNESTRMATVSIHGNKSPDFDLLLGDDAKLNVYLIEDSLKANQANGDTWSYGYVHNGVFRKALGTVMGVSLNEDRSNHYKNVFRFSVPERWKWDRLRVVAFISRPLSNAVDAFTDLMVNNAEVFTFQVSDAVVEIGTDADAVPVDYYDLMGRRYDNPQQGINIVKMSDGTSRKVLVK